MDNGQFTIKHWEGDDSSTHFRLKKGINLKQVPEVLVTLKNGVGKHSFRLMVGHGVVVVRIILKEAGYVEVDPEPEKQDVPK